MEQKELLNQLGKKIKVLRTQKRMTQNALATACEFEKARMSRIESGQANPTFKTLHKISKALEVEMTAFFQNSYC
jgi:transcriptional regulator with XRE-family HTH domain